MENGALSEGKDPSAFLSEITGAPVTVKLNSGVVYQGELQSVDGYMNIALEKTEEYVNGQLRRSYGDAFYYTYLRDKASDFALGRQKLRCEVGPRN